MGLLDGNLSPQDASVLALAGGLLSPGSFGQGLTRGIAGQQAVMGNTQDMDIKRQQLEMAKLQFAVQMRKQQLINNYLSGDEQPQQQQPVAPAGPSIMAGSGSLPGFMQSNPSLVPPAAVPATAPAQAPGFGGLPRSIVAPDLLFNDGKNLAEMTMKYNTPISFRPGGYAMAPNGQMQQLPQVPEGYQAVRGPDGQFKIVKVEGGPEAIAATAEAKASGPAAFKQTEIIDPRDNSKRTVFNRNLPGFRGGSTSATGLVPSDTLSSLSEQLRLIESNGGQPIAPADRPAIDREAAKIRTRIAELSASSLPVGAVQTGLSPGVETGANNAQNVMKDSYKAVMQGAQPAATVQARLDEIEGFSKGAILGGETQWRDFANNLLSIAGVSDKATDRKTAGDLLEKNASQIALAIGTGTQGTDALRSLAAAANPNRHMTQGAIAEAVAQLKASAKVAQAKAALLTPYFNAQNTGAYNSTEQQFDKNADYRLWQLNDMTPQQAQAYRQRIGEKAWADLMSKAKAMKSLGAL